MADIAEISDGNHIAVYEKFSDEGVRYLRGQDLNDFFISDADPIYIPDELFYSLKRSHMNEGDILLSIVGTIGHVGIVTDRFDKLTGNCKLAIIRPEDIESEFIAAFLGSRIGQNEIKRRIRGTIQMGLILPDLKEIPVPILDEDIRMRIVTIIRNAYNKRNESISLYKQSEDVLLDELGLAGSAPVPKLYYERDLSATQAAGRLDAEYFQPKYESIVSVINSYEGGSAELKDWVDIKDDNFYPEDETGYKYIELADIGPYGSVEKCTVRQGSELPSRARRRVSVGDLAVSSVEGSLKSVGLINLEYNGVLCSTGFHVIHSPVINSETLLCFLKSYAGQLQLKKGCSGTILCAIKTAEFSRIILPKIRPEIQVEIQNLVRKSSNTNDESKRLIDDAKRIVDEEVANNTS